MARETAWARRSTPILPKMFLTWDFTVSGAMFKVRAISLFDRPSPSRARTDCSRGLSRGPFVFSGAMSTGGSSADRHCFAKTSTPDAGAGLTRRSNGARLGPASNSG